MNEMHLIGLSLGFGKKKTYFFHIFGHFLAPPAAGPPGFTRVRGGFGQGPYFPLRVRTWADPQGKIGTLHESDPDPGSNPDPDESGPGPELQGPNPAT